MKHSVEVVHFCSKLVEFCSRSSSSRKVCSSSSRKVSGLTPTAVFALATLRAGAKISGSAAPNSTKAKFDGFSLQTD
jgi:hypothetical protein